MSIKTVLAALLAAGLLASAVNVPAFAQEGDEATMDEPSDDSGTDAGDESGGE